ncbi:hypothetical protein BT69DRAFT_971955 [Atractiella rhizophila]|nr:hypothetical protein BT69DRAFT_971955 [Atractiella rhizophila]
MDLSVGIHSYGGDGGEGRTRGNLTAKFSNTMLNISNLFDVSEPEVAHGLKSMEGLSGLGDRSEHEGLSVIEEEEEQHLERLSRSRQEGRTFAQEDASMQDLAASVAVKTPVNRTSPPPTVTARARTISPLAASYTPLPQGARLSRARSASPSLSTSIRPLSNVQNGPQRPASQLQVTERERSVSASSLNLSFMSDNSSPVPAPVVTTPKKEPLQMERASLLEELTMNQSTGDLSALKKMMPKRRLSELVAGIPSFDVEKEEDHAEGEDREASPVPISPNVSLVTFDYPNAVSQTMALPIPPHTSYAEEPARDEPKEGFSAEWDSISDASRNRREQPSLKDSLRTSLRLSKSSRASDPASPAVDATSLSGQRSPFGSRSQKFSKDEEAIFKALDKSVELSRLLASDDEDEDKRTSAGKEETSQLSKDVSKKDMSKSLSIQNISTNSKKSASRRNSLRASLSRREGQSVAKDASADISRNVLPTSLSRGSIRNLSRRSTNRSFSSPPEGPTHEDNLDSLSISLPTPAGRIDSFAASRHTSTPFRSRIASPQSSLDLDNRPPAYGFNQLLKSDNIEPPGTKAKEETTSDLKSDLVDEALITPARQPPSSKSDEEGSIIFTPGVDNSASLAWYTPSAAKSFAYNNREETEFPSVFTDRPASPLPPPIVWAGASASASLPLPSAKPVRTARLSAPPELCLTDGLPEDETAFFDFEEATVGDLLNSQRDLLHVKSNKNSLLLALVINLRKDIAAKDKLLQLQEKEKEEADSQWEAILDTARKWESMPSGSSTSPATTSLTTALSRIRQGEWNTDTVAVPAQTLSQVDDGELMDAKTEIRDLQIRLSHAQAAQKEAESAAETYETRMEQLMQENSDLRDQAVQAATRARDLEINKARDMSMVGRDRRELESQVAELELELEEKREQCIQLQGVVRSMENTCSRLQGVEQELVAAEIEMRRQSSQIQDDEFTVKLEREKAKDAVEARDKAQKEFVMAKAELGTFKSSIDRLKEEKAALMKEKNRLEFDLAKACDERETAVAHLTEAEEAFAMKDDALQVQSKELERLEQVISSTKGEEEDLQRRIRELEEVVTRSKSDIQYQQRSQSQLEEENSRLREEISELDALSTTLKRDYESAVHRRFDLEKKTSALQEEVNRLNAQSVSASHDRAFKVALEQQVDTLLADVSTLRTDAAQNEEKVRMLQDELKITSLQRSECEKELSVLKFKLETQVNKECSQCVERASQVSNLSKELKDCQARLGRMRMDSAERDVAIAQLHKANGELADDVEGLNIALEAKQQELSMLKREMRRESQGRKLQSSTTTASTVPSTARSSMPTGRPSNRVLNSAVSNANFSTARARRTFHHDLATFQTPLMNHEFKPRAKRTSTVEPVMEEADKENEAPTPKSGLSSKDRVTTPANLPQRPPSRTQERIASRREERLALISQGRKTPVPA